MIDRDQPSGKKRPASRAQRNKRGRQQATRISNGRSLAFRILDAQTAIDRLLVGRETSSRKLKQRASKLSAEIDASKAELRKLGFEPEEAVTSAAEYRAHLKGEAFEPQPVLGVGIGTYRLGNKRKNWT